MSVCNCFKQIVIFFIFFCILTRLFNIKFFFLFCVDSLNSKNLAECLSPTGRFSYCALCATSLSCLYKDRVHDEFKLNFLRILCNHLLLMLQLRTMKEMANCELPLDAKVYVRALKKEEVLNDVGMKVIVQDLLLLAISNGKIYSICLYCFNF